GRSPNWRRWRRSAHPNLRGAVGPTGNEGEHFMLTPTSNTKQAAVKNLEAELAELDAEHDRVAGEVDELDLWLEELYGELEIILDRRDGIRERSLKLEEAQT